MARMTSLSGYFWRGIVLGEKVYTFFKLKNLKLLFYLKQEMCDFDITVCVTYIYTFVLPGHLTSAPVCSVKLPWCTMSAGLCTAMAVCRSY